MWVLQCSEIAMIDGVRHIRGFLAVARLGSFTRASIQLHVSQPALTVQLQQLESSLGVKLLDRNKRKVALTQAGEELLIPLECVLNDIESVMSSTRDVSRLNSAIVTVAAVPSVAASLLPYALRDFCRAYPTVSVHLKDSTGNLAELVKQGEVDFGVGGPFQQDSSINTETLYREPICMFAPKEHPLAGKPTITLRELVTHPLILPQRNSDLRDILEPVLQQRGLSLEQCHETSHLGTTVGMVNAGLGIAILPLRAIDCFHSTNVRCIRIVKPKMERRVVIATKIGRSLPPAAEKLIKILRQNVRKFHLSDRKRPI